mmetsp:Transcript_9309/g.27790  ORF Transcript_9309/g.27790 Transcript_9309/m.27790 type:complete len:320 (-) Transcript_9309:96-1055(-)
MTSKSSTAMCVGSNQKQCCPRNRTTHDCSIFPCTCTAVWSVSSRLVPSRPGFVVRTMNPSRPASSHCLVRVLIPSGFRPLVHGGLKVVVAQLRECRVGRQERGQGVRVVGSVQKALEKVQAGLRTKLRHHVAASVKGHKGQAVFVAGDLSGELGSLQGLRHQVGSVQNGFFRQDLQGRGLLAVEPGPVGSPVELVGQDLFDGLPGSLVANAGVRVAVVDPDAVEERQNVPVDVDHGGVGVFDEFLGLPVAGVVFLGVGKANVRHGPGLGEGVGDVEGFADVFSVEVGGHLVVFLGRDGGKEGIVVDVQVFPSLGQGVGG